MAHDQPFLVPIVVDDTPDAAARVPERFRERQWTHLKGGETPAAFCDRVKRLLGGSDGEPPRIHPGLRGSPAAAPPVKPSHPWVLPIIVGLVVVLLITFMLRPRHSPKEIAELVAMAEKFSEPTAVPVSEAQQLVAKAWEQIDKTGIGPEELELADGYCKHAAELDPADAEVWAAWSQVNSLYVAYQFDKTPARREAARSDAARALKLAPESYEARLAQACFLFRTDSPVIDPSASESVMEADRLLRQLLQEKPDEPRALSAFGGVREKLGHLDEGRHAFMLLTRNPEYAARAWRDFAFLEYYFAHDGSAGEALIDRSLAIQQYWGNLSVKAAIAQYWLGDMASAKAAMDRIPLPVMQTDWGVGRAFELYYCLRKPDEWLDFIRGIPRDWIDSSMFDGPTAWQIELALHQAGRNEAADIEWQSALKLVEHRLADQPTSGDLLSWKGKLLTRLGEYAEAEKFLKLANDVDGNERFYDLVDLKIAEGKPDAAMDLMEHEPDYLFSAAYMSLNPDWDPLRNNPRFRALLARFEADPRRSPNAPKPLADTPAPAGVRN